MSLRMQQAAILPVRWKDCSFLKIIPLYTPTLHLSVENKCKKIVLLAWPKKERNHYILSWITFFKIAKWLINLGVMVNVCFIWITCLRLWTTNECGPYKNAYNRNIIRITWKYFMLHEKKLLSWQNHKTWKSKKLYKLKLPETYLLLEGMGNYFLLDGGGCSLPLPFKLRYIWITINFTIIMSVC